MSKEEDTIVVLTDMLCSRFLNHHFHQACCFFKSFPSGSWLFQIISIRFTALSNHFHQTSCCFKSHSSGLFLFHIISVKGLLLFQIISIRCIADSNHFHQTSCCFKYFYRLRCCFQIILIAHRLSIVDAEKPNCTRKKDHCANT